MKVGNTVRNDNFSVSQFLKPSAFQMYVYDFKPDIGLLIGRLIPENDSS